MRCIVHYPHLKTKSRDILPIDENKHARLLLAKTARENLSGEYLHRPQCDNVPSVCNATEHGAHLLCYKNFTLAIALAKRRASKSPAIERKKRPSRDQRGAPSPLFPAKCMDPKCPAHYGMMRYEGKRQKPIKLVTEHACNTLIKAARFRNDTAMLLQIQDYDHTVLIAREIHMHRKCFREYTRPVSEGRRSAEASATVAELQARRGNLRSFVQSQIIDSCQSVSLQLLTDMYGYDGQDSRRRGEVKVKLIEMFGVYFLRHSRIPQFPNCMEQEINYER
jgi:hypothetical protein